jgi:hypothetical protein
MLILLRKFTVKLLCIFRKIGHFITKEKILYYKNSIAYKRVPKFISKSFIGLAPAGRRSQDIRPGHNRTIYLTIHSSELRARGGSNLLPLWKSYRRGRLSTVELLALTSLDLY